jgi:DNA repair protein RadD
MQANHPRTNRLARVQVASVQTLAKRDIPNAALVILDEAHIRATVIERLMAERPDVYFVGLSATPWAQGMQLHWQQLVVACTIGSLIDAGLLSKFAVFAPDVPDLSGVKVARGEYVEDQLAEVMGDAKLVGNVVGNWLARGEDRPTLVFAVNRAHARSLHEEFSRAGAASAYVDGESDAVERGVIGRRFRRGEVRVICSVRTMTTGVDLPVSCIVDAAPTKSEMLHIRSSGAACGSTRAPRIWWCSTMPGTPCASACRPTSTTRRLTGPSQDPRPPRS